MRIAVTGGRDYHPTPDQIRRFEHQWCELDGSILFEGGATGVDEWARIWAIAMGIPVATVSVNTRIDGPWPAAGPIRSRRMLEDGKVEVLFGFPGNRGTAGTISEGLRLGITVLVWADEQGDFVWVDRKVVRAKGGASRGEGR